MTEQEWREQFAENLKERLEEYGYSQRDLADIVGISESAISRYLYGQQVPKATVILNIAYALDCSVDELIDFDDRVIM